MVHTERKGYALRGGKEGIGSWKKRNFHISYFKRIKKQLDVSNGQWAVSDEVKGGGAPLGKAND